MIKIPMIPVMKSLITSFTSCAESQPFRCTGLLRWNWVFFVIILHVRTLLISIIYWMIKCISDLSWLLKCMLVYSVQSSQWTQCSKTSNCPTSLIKISCIACPLTHDMVFLCQHDWLDVNWNICSHWFTKECVFYLSAYIALISLLCQNNDLSVGVVLLYHIAECFQVKTIKNCWISASVGLQVEPLFTV